MRIDGLVNRSNSKTRDIKDFPSASTEMTVVVKVGFLAKPAQEKPGSFTHILTHICTYSLMVRVTYVFSNLLGKGLSINTCAGG